ncbi:MAG: hypothetical protein ACI8ZN_002387 [Bacteroidia bacterium]|jgi:hypothetical protein
MVGMKFSKTSLLRSAILVGLIAVGLNPKAQSTAYFGLDLGPKVDYYSQAAVGGSPSYQPNLRIHNDVAGVFGLVFGLKLDSNVWLETGLYKSNFRANFDIIGANGARYFDNTPVNTFTSFVIPINYRRIYEVKKHMFPVPIYLTYGTGLTFLGKQKLGLTEAYRSIAEPVNPADVSEGYVEYSIFKNEIRGKMMMLNLNAGVQYRVNSNLMVNILATYRYGISGANNMLITHKFADFEPITNKISTKGNELQLTFGFRYFLIES